MTTQMTHKMVLKLINDLGITANYPIEDIIEFVNSKGGIDLRESTLAEVVEYNNIINEARKYLQQEQVLREISRIGQEEQSEDYKIENNNKEEVPDAELWFSGNKNIW